MQHLLTKLLDWLLAFAPRLLGAALILAGGWWLGSLLANLLTKTIAKGKMEDGAKTFIGSVIKICVRIIVGISALATLGMDMTSIITAVGATGVTIGLALKDSLSNFASGVLILFNKPFVVGDYLEVEGSGGTVEKIELMFTTLCTPDNKQLVYPNSHLTTSKLINYTAEGTRRLDMDIPVEYSQDIGAVRKCIQCILDKQPLILYTEKDAVVVNGFDESAVRITVRVWCKTEDYWTLKFGLYEQIKEQFDKENIIIPFNQLDVHICQ